MSPEVYIWETCQVLMSHVSTWNWDKISHKDCHMWACPGLDNCLWSVLMWTLLTYSYITTSSAPNCVTSLHCNNFPKKITAWAYSKSIFGKSMLNVIHHGLHVPSDQSLQSGGCRRIGVCVCGYKVHLSSSTNQSKSKPASPISFSAAENK